MCDRHTTHESCLVMHALLVTNGSADSAAMWAADALLRSTYVHCLAHFVPVLPLPCTHHDFTLHVASPCTHIPFAGRLVPSASVLFDPASHLSQTISPDPSSYRRVACCTRNSLTNL